MIILFIIVQFIAAVNSQYLAQPDFKPDITFGEHNDRFDLTSLIHYQNKYYNDNLPSIDARRRSDRGVSKRPGGKWLVLDARGSQKTINKIKRIAARELDEIGRLMKGWRRSGDDVYLIDDERQDPSNFEMSVDDLGTRRSLDNVFINLGSRRRAGRVSDALLPGKRDGLLKYAVPIEMVVHGFLVIPPTAV
ncbi:unnamed protein product, partial [Iphiclides podalirius]